MVNPIAAYWLHDSRLFKQLHQLSNSPEHDNTAPPISHRAVARYLYLQLELVQSVFVPINDTIVQCIHVSSMTMDRALLNATIKFFSHSAALEHLTSTFKVQKAQYWLRALLKLKRLLFDVSSPYYKVTTHVYDMLHRPILISFS